MQENSSPRPERGCCTPSPDNEDAKAQRAVLTLALAEHPAQLTIIEVAREIDQGEGFAEHDAVERAIRDLVGIGLLHCPGGFVMPTRAALHFDRLMRS